MHLLLLVDIRVLDHIIVAGGTTLSFAERGFYEAHRATHGPETVDYPIMTTREYLRARVIRLYRYTFLFVLVMLATTIWGRHSLVLSGLAVGVITAYLAGYR